jgi:hypothetical protein
LNDVFNLEEFEDSAEQAVTPQLSQTETVEIASTPRHRRWWIPYAALVAVLAAAGAGLFAAWWSSHRHQDALAQQAINLGNIVAKKAGPGLDTAFDFSSAAKAGTLTLTSPTTFYVACTNGQAVLGPFTEACDGKLAVYGPYGTRGTTIRISLPASPWALVARPQDQGLIPATPTLQPTANR